MSADGDLQVVSGSVVSTPDGVTASPSWTGLGADGAAENVIATDVALEAGETHVYLVDVIISLAESDTAPVVTPCSTRPDGGTGGLTNAAEITHNDLDSDTEACVTIAVITIEKSISYGPTPNGDGTWTIEYDLVAENIGAATGEYDLSDRLRYGDGIEVLDAGVVSAPDGVTPNAEWTGQGDAETAAENVIAAAVSLEAEGRHSYRVRVMVALDEADVSAGALECPAPGSGESGGLANSATLNHNGEAQSDEACASLPLIEITKSVSGAAEPVPGMAGIYDITYELQVTNSGSGDGVYDLSDELAPGEGIAIVGVESVTTDAPDSVGINAGFDGVSDTTIVSAQPIDGAETGPVVHRYFVTVRYQADLSNVTIPSTDMCTDASGGTVSGGLANTATVSWNDLEDEDDACVRPGKPTLDKQLVSADAIGDGQWRVVYDLIVGNVGGEATTYDLDDELLFAPAVTVDSVSVVGPDGVTLNGAFDGETELRVASDVAIAGLDDIGYEPHVYRVTVVAHVPLHFDEPEADGTGSTACTLPGGENTIEQGLNNAATLTDETGGTSTDTDCAALPSFAVTKEIIGGAVRLGDGTWQIDYRILVVNDGAADGVYTLTDKLRFGDAIRVVQAEIVGAPDSVAVASGWTGQGADGAAENVVAADVSLPSGDSHAYHARVVASIDEDVASAVTFTCPAPGSGASGGFANTAGVEHNGLSDEAEACAPPVPTTEISRTGSGPVAVLLGIAGLLLLGGALVVVAARRAGDAG